MAAKPRSEWSDAYRRRIERAEAKAAAEGREFSKKAARGKTQDEYRARRASETRRARSSVPGAPPALVSRLTPAEIRQLRAFGASDQDVLDVADRSDRHAILRRQMRVYRGYEAPRTAEDDEEEGREAAPAVVYYYHFNPTLG